MGKGAPPVVKSQNGEMRNFPQNNAKFKSKQKKTSLQQMVAYSWEYPGRKQLYVESQYCGNIQLWGDGISIGDTY